MLEHCHLYKSTRRIFESQQSEFIDVVSNEDSYMVLEALSHSLRALLPTICFGGLTPCVNWKDGIGFIISSERLDGFKVPVAEG